ncbi:hypothetical protein K6L44_02875 [Gluconacetobacter entanii]|uniref:tetratricopeptide repeat protein n=1 Tax=Gluconacetobacter entanii TaxID=108528 RepID=UPI001C935D87|nr:hypothetical protein [Gluconacetobacter entanii]MBY4638962.1 hypothetical protein [Gluconacetobacter entanii]MCW4580042.1 hypothetical protein [Gluconacetobacter entanii]MCW4583429.1 hypothetical protein [Gluconacetobacter entanii]MCW4586775.1 hypothetical protein [Gluconacetobacter entanii]
MTVRFHIDATQGRVGTGMNRGLRGLLSVVCLGVVGMAAPCFAASAPPAPPAHPAPAAKGTDKDRAAKEPGIPELQDELRHAKSKQAASDLLARIEQLRQKDITPTTRLLVRRAQSDLAEQKVGDAQEDLNDALVLQPGLEILWRTRAQARLAGADANGAVADLGVALHHDERDVLAWQILSNAEGVRGDWGAAWKAWQHVLTLYPLLPGAAHQTEDLRLKAFGRPT